MVLHGGYANDWSPENLDFDGYLYSINFSLNTKTHEDDELEFTYDGYIDDNIDLDARNKNNLETTKKQD